MIIKEQPIKKILAFWLVFLLVFNPLLVPLAWAEEESSAEETTVVQEEIQPESSDQSQSESSAAAETSPEDDSSPDQSAEEDPAGGETNSESEVQTEEQPDSIVSGDAEALAEVETTANTHQETVPGEITVPPEDCQPLEGEENCPDEVVIENENLAAVADEATASAGTGGNKIEGAAGDASIKTGEATAGANLKNEVNRNLVAFEREGSEGETEVAAEENAETAVEGENGSEATIENQNEGVLTNQAAVAAVTGENQANENGGDASIETGEALAWANLFNLLNTNLVGSDFEALFLDLLQGYEGDLDLNKIWQEILAKEGSDSLVLAEETQSSNLNLLVQNQNQAVLENKVAVQAASGGNEASGNQGQAVIETGEATALANVTNFVNTNIVGAKFFLGVINVLGSFEGNLVLPRPEHFASFSPAADSEEETPSLPVVFENQNQTEIQNQVVAQAETGTNEETNNSGENLIETGQAQARVNTFSLVNFNLWRNNWFFLVVNHLGDWSGKIFSWSNPSAVEEADEDSQIYQLGLETSASGEGQNLEIEEELPFLSFENQNQATVKNEIQSLASTGQNQAKENQAGATIKTGQARSLVNLLNFVNLNILGGRWFLGLVNILGDWSGNTIFAYPDVTLSLANQTDQVMAGETMEYILHYQNQGYDRANGVRIEVTLPEGLSLVGDSSGLTPEITGQTASWFLGTLEAGEEGQFAIKVKIDPHFSFPESLSFWSKIIPQVQAAENEKEGEVLVTAAIGTVDPESNLENNSASVKTLVYLPPSESESSSTETGVDQRQPVLEISAANNVGEFVYPGDTITFEVIIKNTGEVPAIDTYFVQKLFNSLPEEDFGTVEFKIGTLGPHQGVKLSFGLQLADNGLLSDGTYHTSAQAFGTAPNGNGVSSNEARTEFEVRLKATGSLFEARALGKEEGEVLGALENSCQSKEEILPYVLLFILSSIWLSDWAKTRLKLKKK